MSQPPAERASLQSLMGAQVYSILVICTNIAFGAAALGSLWLLASLIFGHYADFSQTAKATQAATLNNIKLASTLLTGGLAIGSILAALAYFGEEIIGYLLLGGAALVGIGIPFGFQQFGGENYAATKSAALAHVYAGFLGSVTIPCILGALLITYDVILRLVKAVRERPTVKAEKMAYGTGAKKENSDRPPRLSILGKCWEGPYCRDFIRPHCPIFLKRQACWKQRMGCYCEEDIVAAAASKVTGPSLPMVNSSRFGSATAPANEFNSIPDPGLSGFSAVGAAPGYGSPGLQGPGLAPPPPSGVPAPPRRVELTKWQKAERCRNCIIYNEHQREKYQLMLPVTIIGSLLLCALLAIQFHTNMGVVVTGMERLINQFSFLPGSNKVEIGNASGTVAWVFLGAVAIMLTSKALQVLEWCIFKIKI